MTESQPSPAHPAALAERDREYAAAIRRALDVLHEASALSPEFDSQGAVNRADAKRALRCELKRYGIEAQG